jgi:hypothetical protein
MTGTFTKRLIYICGAAIICVALISHGQGTDQDAVHEVELKANIAKDPKAERPLFDYAYFLYTKKRFKDSREQVLFLFGLNKAHVGGRKLIKSLDEVEGLADLEYQEQQMRMYIVEKMKLDREEEVKSVESTGGELTPEKIAKIQVDLDKRYEFTYRMKMETKIAPAELRFQDALNAASKAGQYIEAEKTGRTWVATFEKSAIAQADFGTFLIMRGRYPQAEVVLTEALKSNPDSLKLRIVNDLLKDIKSVKSSEKIADLKGRLTNELSVYQLTVNGKIEEAKRAPSEAKTATPAPGSTAPVANAEEKSVEGLPAVITPEQIEKMKLPPTANPPMQRRK